MKWHCTILESEWTSANEIETASFIGTWNPECEVFAIGANLIGLGLDCPHSKVATDGVCISTRVNGKTVKGFPMSLTPLLHYKMYDFVVFSLSGAEDFPDTTYFLIWTGIRQFLVAFFARSTVHTRARAQKWLKVEISQVRILNKLISRCRQACHIKIESRSR